MKITIGFLLLAFLNSVSFAQKPNEQSVVREKRKLCELILSKFSGKPESIDSLITLGKEGLALAKTNDYNNRFALHQSVGTGYYYKQDFPNASKQFELAYDMGVKAGTVSKSLKPLGNLIAIYHYMGLQKKADDAAQKLKQIVEHTDTLKGKSDIYYNLGIYNQQQKFYYSIALENFLKSVALHKPLMDTTKVLKIKLDYGTKLMMVAEIYLYLKQPRKALEYLDEVKPYLNLSIIYDVTAYGKFIRAYALLQSKKEALRYYDLLHKTAGANPGRWSELISSNIELSYLSLKEKNFKEAIKYADKANKQAALDGKDVVTSSVNMLYGDYYKAINNITLAEKYYKLAENALQIYNKEEYANLLKNLTEVEIQSGKQVAAENYFKKYTVAADSLNQRKVSLNLAEMEARYQNQYKQTQIGELNKENASKNEQLQQERNTRILLMSAAILLVIALVSIYLNYRNKQKVNLLLDKKNKQLDIINAKLNVSNETKTKLFSIISHDLRSPVSQLFTFLKLQSNGFDFSSEEEFQRHQQKLMSSSANLLETMEDLLLWSKSQMEHFQLEMEEVQLQELFETVINLMQSQADAKNVVLSVGELMVNSARSDYNLLLAILRNLVQNAIRHGANETTVQLRSGFTKLNKPYISVHNFGNSFPEEKIIELLQDVQVNSKSSGYGLMIVKELTEKLNAELQIQSTEVDGTEVRIVFNVT